MEHYYKPEHLQNFREIEEGHPELAKKFFSYYSSVFENDALTKREKSLIALAVSHAIQCPYCIDAYSKGCLQEGLDIEEMVEAIHVATAIRGGASLVHGMQTLDHVKKISM